MNLNELETPQVIEEVSINDIIEQMKARLIAIDSKYTAYVESDPLVKLMEVCAYRELLLRQRINQAAKSNLLAFATGPDLDNLGAFYDVKRKEGETDEEFRKRIQLKIVGWSSAGSRAAYIYHALNSDPRVKEANADSPEPGLVRISILSKENGGIVSDNLLEAVDDFHERIVEGLKFYRLAGTPYALRMAMSWYGFVGIKIEGEEPGRHFAEFQIGLKGIPNNLDISQMISAAQLAAPLRSRLSRIYNDLYDIRRFILDYSDWGDLLSDHSGNYLYEGSPKFSFGRVNMFDVEVAPVDYTYVYNILRMRYAFVENNDRKKLDWTIIDNTTGATSIEPGKIYLQGLVRDVNDGNFVIPVDVSVRIGVYFKEQTITELEDDSLRDPAVGTRNFQEVGAICTQYSTTWGYQTWGAGKPKVTNNAIRVVQMADIESMRNMISDLYYLISQLQLKNDANASDPTAKKGIFVDPFFDDDMRDQGTQQTGAIVDGKLTLPIDVQVFDFAKDKEAFLLPYELEPVITQEYQTGSMKINPYNAFDPLPADVEVTLNIDHWTDVETEWLSPIRWRFGRGSRNYETFIGTTTVAAEYMRQITQSFTVKGLKAGEEITKMTFAGIEITPEGGE